MGLFWIRKDSIMQLSEKGESYVKRLDDILQNKTGYHLFPFYWQHGDHRQKIPEQIERISQSGCRGFCVESRPHPAFGKDGWWEDLDLILQEAKKRDMHVWLLDDDHFPSGHANGKIASEHPELRAHHLMETHVDLAGPMRSASVLLRECKAEETLIGAFIVRRKEDEALFSQVIDVTDCVRGRWLNCDIPDGFWRAFFLYDTQAYANPDYIDMLNEKSVRVLIDAVYEPHYARYHSYFGNTFQGFFSDEPQFRNERYSASPIRTGFYDTRVGVPGVCLPWSREIRKMLAERLNEDPLPYLCGLWYDMEGRSSDLRYYYMDAVTRRYRDCFSKQIGDWCRAHGVGYIGHTVEDMNACSHLGGGAGHFFRALDGQTMSGIDIVLHQVLPGFAHHVSCAMLADQIADPAFFHYVLAQLAVSDAQLDPKKEGRAMCEVFGAYGWAEGTRIMKWLADFLLVRGINYFVPHAFSPTYPDPDSPPHFGAEGHDPQFDGFSFLMRYIDKTAHLLSGGKMLVDVAVLFHADGEWMSDPHFDFEQEICKQLLDQHLNYMILSSDHLLEGKLIDGKFSVNGYGFDVILVPYAKRLPFSVLNALQTLQSGGVTVMFGEALPENAYEEAWAVPYKKMPELLPKYHTPVVQIQGSVPLLRHLAIKQPDGYCFMFFNESITKVCTAQVLLPVSGEYVYISGQTDTMFRGLSVDGRIDLSLKPYESCIVVFGEIPQELPFPLKYGTEQALSLHFTIELADSEILRSGVAMVKQTSCLI